MGECWIMGNPPWYDVLRSAQGCTGYNRSIGEWHQLWSDLPMNDPLWSHRVREDGDGSGVMTVGNHFFLSGMIVAWLTDDNFGDGK